MRKFLLFVSLLFIVAGNFLSAQTSGEQFFDEVTPGICGVFPLPNSPYLAHKEFSFSITSNFSPYKIFPYTKRAWLPALFTEFGFGVLGKYNVFLSGGIYPKNETEKLVFPWQAGIRFSLLKNEEREHLSLLLLYGQLRNLKYHPRDPNLTTRFNRLSKLDGVVEFNKKIFDIFFDLGIGYQYVWIDGSYWQEAAGNDIISYDSKKGYFMGNINFRKKIFIFTISLGAGISKDIPTFGLSISLPR
jgi:hypothetical protein